MEDKLKLQLLDNAKAFISEVLNAESVDRLDEIASMIITKEDSEKLQKEAFDKGVEHASQITQVPPTRKRTILQAQIDILKDLEYIYEDRLPLGRIIFKDDIVKLISDLETKLNGN